MNTLGLILLSCVAHATGFALAGALIYLAWRRISPAAGSLAAASCLILMAVVSLVVIGPWPEWWVLAGDETQNKARAVGSIERELSAPSHPERANALIGASGRAASPDSRFPRGQNELSTTAAWASVFAHEWRRELLAGSATAGPARYGWLAWVAIGFLASLGLGLIRLLLGLWAIGRVRAGSRPIDDQKLGDAIEILRAELSWSRRVEVRETSELSSPATIGWRRPLVLLPRDWRDWNQAERQSVLAHELAHVRRGDFAAGMASQLCLALHFYHPLAHWLAARLRLEQELAADAWAARLTGGQHAYLTNLAHMALRRDGRALSWPARAFLPTRGTFVRRIEMLRNAGPIRHASLSIAARLLTIGTLAALGLLVAGLRGPSGAMSALAQPPGPRATANEAAGTEAFNLAFVPADAKMLLAIRPSALLKRREFRSLAGQIKLTVAKPLEVLPIEDIDQLLAFWEGIAPPPDEPMRRSMVPPPSGIVVRTTKRQDWNTILKQVFGSSREVRHAGQVYVALAGADPSGWAAFPADERALLLAREDLLRELLEDRNGPAPGHPWDEAWEKVAKGQMMLAVETRWVRRRLAPGLQGSLAAPGQSPSSDLKLDTISPLLEKAHSYALSIDATGGFAVDLIAAARSEADAKPIADTISALLTLARNAVSGMRQDLRGQSGLGGQAMEWGFQSADNLLDKAQVETSARFVHLQAKASLDLAEGVELLAPAISSAQSAARRSVSVNNLKQILLAIHNYASVNDAHLPAPVLYGGPNKSIPYSWRVAILPFLEQNDLYKQYNFDEPWDGPSNRKLIDKMPSVYGYPAPAGGTLSRTDTAYFVLAGEAGALGAPAKGNAAGPSIMDITDGTSNTIMVVEAKREIPWTKPEDIPFDRNGPLPELGGFDPKSFSAAFGDGSVRTISKTIDPRVLRALFTRKGGEVIDLGELDPRMAPATKN